MSDVFTILAKSPNVDLESFTKEFQRDRHSINAVLISIDDLIGLIGCTPNEFEKYINIFVNTRMHSSYYKDKAPVCSWTFTSLFLDYLSTLKLEISYVLNWCYAYDIHIAIYDASSLHYLIDNIRFFPSGVIGYADTSLLQYAIMDDYHNFHLKLLDDKTITVSDVKTFQSVIFYKQVYNYLSATKDVKLTHMDK